MIRFAGADFAALRCYKGNSSAATTSTSIQKVSSTGGANSPSTTGDSAPVNTGVLQLNSEGPLTVTDNPVITGQAMDALKLLGGEAITGISDAAKTVAESLRQSIDGSTQQGNNNSQLLQAILSDQASLAKQVNSGGQTEANKTIITTIGILAGAAVLGLFFFRKK